MGKLVDVTLTLAPPFLPFDGERVGLLLALLGEKEKGTARLGEENEFPLPSSVVLTSGKMHVLFTCTSPWSSGMAVLLLFELEVSAAVAAHALLIS